MAVPIATSRVAYLDGIRALAIIGVILFHWGGFVASRFQGGYVGVDLFFVLSGFIITRILWSRGDALSYRGFLAARAKRLYPALIGVVVVASVLVVLVGQGWKRTALASLLALTQLNTFAIPAGVTFYEPFGVTWSLSAEWVSYLVLPLVILLARRWPALRRSPRNVGALLGLLAILMYLGSLLLPISWLYFGPLSRAAQIFAGGAVALVTIGVVPTRRAGLIFGVGGGIALVALLVWGVIGIAPLTAEYAFIGLPVVTLAGMLLILSGVLSPRSPLSRLLALAPLALLGRTSYSLYLWHVVPFAILGPLTVGMPMPL